MFLQLEEGTDSKVDLVRAYVLSLSENKRKPIQFRRTGDGDCGEFCLYSQRIA